MFVFAGEGIKYDFDEVEVINAAEFKAKPVSVEADNWLAELAGGKDKPITVLYGVVNLKKNQEIFITEEFIKITGENGSERFLLNSGVYDYYYGTSKYQSIKSFFWSAKRLVDNVVVKDFTPPIKSITFYREFDENQNIYKVILSSSNDGEEALQKFWSTVPTENLYQADIDTLSPCNGDLNKDGSITLADALIIFNCYFELGPCTECCDADGNGRVTPADALCLFQRYLGISSSVD